MRRRALAPALRSRPRSTVLPCAWGVSAGSQCGCQAGTGPCRDGFNPDRRAHGAGRIKLSRSRPGRNLKTTSTLSAGQIQNLLSAQNLQKSESAAPGAGGSAATAKAALSEAAGRHAIAVVGTALDAQQAALSKDLHAAMGKAGIKLAGAVEFSLDGKGSLAIHASDADQTATKAFLKADTSQPSFTSRVTSLVRDASSLSSKIQQTAAISQAARQGGKPAGVLSLYTSLMQQTQGNSAVFAVAAGSSSLSYTGALSAKA